MAILRERQTWSSPSTGKRPRSLSGLTTEEQANVRTALRVLRLRVGSFSKLAAVLGVTKVTLVHAASKGGRPSVGLALRAARLAYVPLEDILSGRWPGKGPCALCGK